MSCRRSPTAPVPRVHEAFVHRYRCEFRWPWLTMIGDVRRPDLLFEVEVTACPNAKTTATER